MTPPESGALKAVKKALKAKGEAAKRSTEDGTGKQKSSRKGTTTTRVSRTEADGTQCGTIIGFNPDDPLHKFALRVQEAFALKTETLALIDLLQEAFEAYKNSRKFRKERPSTKQLQAQLRLLESRTKKLEQFIPTLSRDAKQLLSSARLGVTNEMLFRFRIGLSLITRASIQAIVQAKKTKAGARKDHTIRSFINKLMSIWEEGRNEDPTVSKGTGGTVDHNRYSSPFVTFCDECFSYLDLPQKNNTLGEVITEVRQRWVKNKPEN